MATEYGLTLWGDAATGTVQTGTDLYWTMPKNITIVSVNCRWKGTAAIFVPEQGYYTDPVPAYSTTNNTSSGGYAAAASPGQQACASCAPLSGWTCTGGSYSITRNGSPYSSGNCGAGQTICAPVCTTYVSGGKTYTYAYAVSITCYFSQTVYHPAVPSYYVKTADAYYKYSTPTSVAIGGVTAASNPSGALGAGSYSTPANIDPSKLVAGVVKFSQGTVGGNGTAIFEVNIVYTLKNPTAACYLKFYDENNTLTQLPLCKLNDPQLVNSTLRMQGPAFALESVQFYDTSSYSAKTTEAANATTNDVPCPPGANRTGDILYFGYKEPFNGLYFKMGTPGVYTGTILWEYWNGSTWTALSNVSDGTVSFTAAAGEYTTHWDFPSNWATTAVNSVTKYWVRARCSACSAFTTQPLLTMTKVSEILCADLIPNSGNDRTEWSGIAIRIGENTTGGPVMVWRRKL